MPPESASPIFSRGQLRASAITAAAVCAIAVIMGLTTRRMADAKLVEWTETEALPVVATATPDSRGKKTTLDLPGRLEAYSQAQIYARVTGYLKEWKVDIGATVKAGQVLAEIDAPDLDQQIMQAEADLTSTQANSILSDANLVRGQSLIVSGSVSKQDLEQRTADSASKRGLAKSSKANVDRMRVLEKYKSITAPFDGLVTSRATDVGALINAGGGGAPLFVISEISRLRVYVNIPQSYVPSIKIGTKAEMTVPEYPERRFPATIEASAQSVDIATGTTRMLLVVDNSDGQLMTGGFATVSIDLSHPAVALNVPVSALIFTHEGLRVATVGTDNRVVLKSVTISRDLGKEIEIGSGLTAADQVIENPPDGIASGDQVRVSRASGGSGKVATAK
jgi:RND family efflux transporter MFP subunit